MRFVFLSNSSLGLCAVFRCCSLLYELFSQQFYISVDLFSSQHTRSGAFFTIEQVLNQDDYSYDMMFMFLMNHIVDISALRFPFAVFVSLIHVQCSPVLKPIKGFLMVTHRNNWWHITFNITPYRWCYAIIIIIQSIIINIIINIYHLIILKYIIKNKINELITLCIKKWSEYFQNIQLSPSSVPTNILPSNSHQCFFLFLMNKHLFLNSELC